MKEYPERTFGKNQERLTIVGSNLTLRSEGNFMAEQGGEQPPKPPVTPEVNTPSVSPDKIEAAKKAWEGINVASADERTTIGEMIKMGIGPDDYLKLYGPDARTAAEGRRVGPGAMAAPPPPEDPRFNPDSFENPALKSIARRMQTFQPSILGSAILQSRVEELRGLIARGELSEQDIAGAEGLLSNIEEARIRQEQELRRRAEEPLADDVTPEERALIESGSYRLYLEPQDILTLSRNPTKWLDQQFDVLYKSVQEGQELTSPMISQLQSTVGYAVRFVMYHKPEELDKFQTLFTQRLKIMTMRTYIGYRAIGEVKNAAIQLRAHGLLSGFGMEDGRVLPVFNRLNELLDDERLQTAVAGQQFGHVTPEIANQLQENVIQEQISLAELGIGDFGNLSPGALENLEIPEGVNPQEFRDAYKERVNADIVRSVRIAYDLFVNTQRQAVIVARGRHLYGTENYFSDPASGPLNVYNFEDLLTEKFDLFNRPEYEFLNRIKLDLAESYIRKKRSKRNLSIEEVRELQNLRQSKEERLELGKRLFRDLFAVPDFFSSGWRVEGIATSIEERFVARFVDRNADEATRNQQTADAIDRARNMALFLRLKGAGSDEAWQITKQDAWERIAKYRPEDVVRLFRERAQGDANLEGRLTGLFSNDIFTANGVTNYDQFKEKYGTVLRIIRDRGYKDFRVINIAQDGFTEEERVIIERYFGNANEADNLQQMFTLMTTFSRNSVNDLLNNNRFEDIYTRTIDANDAILSELEKKEIKSIHRDADGNEITKKVRALSDRWSADQGGDALIRNWNDTENAVKAGEALMHFIKAEEQKEKLKAALEFADSTSRYTSQLQLAKCLRYTYGTFLLVSKKDFPFDVADIGKAPFRKAISDIERIYGPSGVPKGRDELRSMIDEVSSRLEGSISKAVREGRLSDDERLEIQRRGITEEEFKEGRYEKALEGAREFEEDLIIQTENAIRDVIKRRSLGILLYIILASLVEVPRTAKEALKAAA